VRITWQPKRKSRSKDQNGPDEADQRSDKHIKDIEQAANEFKDILVQVIGCDITNTIHSAKLQRLGETHIAKAKEFCAKLKAEIAQAKRQANDCPSKCIKNISRSIGGPKAKPLMGVFRDRDTPDGGKAGHITSDPAEIDAVVKRAWKAVYDGMQGCILKAVEIYLDTYGKFIFRMREVEIQPLDGPTVYESFCKIKESAAALDGWSPKELSLVSPQTCVHIADMLNQIEAGSP